MYNVYDLNGEVLIISQGETIAEMSFLFQPIYSYEINGNLHYEVLSQIVSYSDDVMVNDAFFSGVNDDFIKSLCLKQLKVAQKFGIGSTISVNATISCIADFQFVLDVLEFKELKVALEISELNCYTCDKKILANIAYLQKNGVMIWLDDYHINNEQANLSLGVIEWDYIKIDKKFLFFNCKDSVAAQQLTQVLSPFTKNGLIFEGVETFEQSLIVKSTGSLSQGYFHSYPKQWPEIIKDINNNILAKCDAY
ncbi:EAL domain-containing protein [Vibrio crassostreae]|nr:EAL domain-containing protein [Vibrio crassostreae]